MRGALAMALAAMLALAACSPLGTLNAVIPGSSYTLSANVAYGPLPRQRLDIYRPTAAAPAAGWPARIANDLRKFSREINREINDSEARATRHE